MRALSAFAVMTTLMLGLSACAPEAGESGAETLPEQTSTQTPTPTPTPTPEPVAVILPTCTEILSDEKVGEFFETGFMLLDYEAIGGDPWLRNLLGPRAVEAHEIAAQSVECVWGIQNSDQFTAVSVAELSEPAMADFIEALQASDYVEDQVNGMPVFRYGMGMETGMPQHNWYGFHENVWVAVSTVWGERESFSMHVLEQVVAANS